MRVTEWTSGKRAAPEPLEGPVVGSVLVVTLAWAALFVVQVPFYGWYADRGHAWWLWTCLTGAGLGLPGLWIVRRREAALARERDQGQDRGRRPVEPGRESGDE